MQEQRDVVNPIHPSPKADWVMTRALNMVAPEDRARIMANGALAEWAKAGPDARTFVIASVEYTITEGPFREGDFICVRISARRAGGRTRLAVDDKYRFHGLNPLVADGAGSQREDWIAALQQIIHQVVSGR